MIVGATGSILTGLLASAAVRVGGPASETSTTSPIGGSLRHTTWLFHDTGDSAVGSIRSLDDVAELRRSLSEHVAAHPDGQQVDLMIGLGPRVVAAVDPSLPGTEGLPSFRFDDAMEPAARGTDLAIALEATDPIPSAVVQHLAAATPSFRLRWSAHGHRVGERARNPFGFHDEIVIPRTSDELDEHIRIPDGAAAGGTMCVIRLLALDVARFSALDVSRQEAIIGRRRHTGAPLSGSSIDDPIDLQARSLDGTLLVPERAHVRAANPTLLQSPLMFRRSYEVVDVSLESAARHRRHALMLFVSYQRSIDTFTATQRRLDVADDLMSFARPIASASMLIPAVVHPLTDDRELPIPR